MTREILFKGKTTKGEWVEGLLCKPLSGKYSNSTFISNKAGSPLAYEVRPETVGQFTGMYDLNDNKIFENDFLYIFVNGDLYGDGVEYVENEYTGVVRHFLGSFEVVPNRGEQLHQDTYERDSSGNRYVDGCTCEEIEVLPLGSILPSVATMEVVGNIFDETVK